MALHIPPQSAPCLIDFAAIDRDLASGKLKAYQLHEPQVLSRYTRKAPQTPTQS